jgi:WhiB family transcriptional regulator, redox-sensing transcriptional regulator
VDASDVRNRSRARLDEAVASKVALELEPEGEFSIPLPTGLENGWMRSAACLESEPEVFFPPGPSAVEHIAEAKEVCQGCAVVSDCLRVAMADPTLLGVWGGTSEQERAGLRRRPSQPTLPTQPTQPTLPTQPTQAAQFSEPAQGLVWIST